MFHLSSLRSKLAAAGLVAALAAPIVGLNTQAWAIDDSEKAEFEKLIHEYLVKNPEILVEMQDAFEKKQQELQANKQKNTLTQMKDKIFNSKYLHTIGNPDAKTTVVEFFDYNCGFCRKAMEDMNKIIEKDKDIKFEVREFPVLGPESQEAHQVAVAFGMLMPEKYPEFHRKLLTAEGRKNGEVATALAIEMGADEAELKKKMEAPDVATSFQEAYELADGLGITGTPSYIIGDEVIFGAVGFDKLQEAIEATRK